MRYECRITVLETKCFLDLQEKYLDFQNRADRHPGERRGAGVAGKAEFPEHGRGCVHRVSGQRGRQFSELTPLDEDG